MKFEESLQSKLLSHHKLEMPFGTFFFCENFVISEIHSEKHFDWPKIELVLKEIIDFYGAGAKLGYVSNRVNSYSIDPSHWAKINSNKAVIEMIGTCIVYYNYIMYLNASLENRFSDVEIKSCLSLDEAIEWVQRLNY
ncbi:hypothetical protein KFZ70_12755 [Tamlana fucoidanivorans]|uniref:STAS/SEC14 domain-containing protein n=1 Tax=Allotamlana fucoidanivorans TaxID=2583814 RepID=A0A5C4SDN9_9FLAO|nr:hypothetical protein [Tamlana fucoidanivorans]TNJ41525.1 hypothetical protein FGF67_15735 [Tamlana fucoidanivorans]